MKRVYSITLVLFLTVYGVSSQSETLSYQITPSYGSHCQGREFLTAPFITDVISGADSVTLELTPLGGGNYNYRYSGYGISGDSLEEAGGPVNLSGLVIYPQMDLSGWMSLVESTNSSVVDLDGNSVAVESWLKLPYFFAAYFFSDHVELHIVDIHSSLLVQLTFQSLRQWGGEVDGPTYVSYICEVSLSLPPSSVSGASLSGWDNSELLRSPLLMVLFVGLPVVSLLGYNGYKMYRRWGRA